MKRNILLTLCVILGISFNLAAHNTDQIHTKNGMVYEGYISEQLPGRHIAIYTERTTMTIPSEEVKSLKYVTAEVKNLKASLREWLEENRPGEESVKLASFKWKNLQYSQSIVLEKGHNMKFVCFAEKENKVEWKNIVKTTKTAGNFEADHGTIDVITLKNGKRYEGYVVEQILGKETRIMTAPHEITTIKASDVLSIRSELLNPQMDLWTQVRYIDRIELADGRTIEGFISSRVMGSNLTIVSIDTDEEIEVPLRQVKKYFKFPNEGFVEWSKPALVEKQEPAAASAVEKKAEPATAPAPTPVKAEPKAEPAVETVVEKTEPAPAPAPAPTPAPAPVKAEPKAKPAPAPVVEKKAESTVVKKSEVVNVSEEFVKQRLGDEYYDALKKEQEAAAKVVENEPAIEEVTTAYVVEDFVVEESTVEEITTAYTVKEPVAEEPSTAYVVEEPAVEEPTTAYVVEEPVAEEPTTAYVVEEPVAEEPTIAYVVEEPTAEEPIAEEPVAEEPVAEEPTVAYSVKEPAPAPAPAPAPKSQFSQAYIDAATTFVINEGVDLKPKTDEYDAVKSLIVGDEVARINGEVMVLNEIKSVDAMHIIIKPVENKLDGKSIRIELSQKYRRPAYRIVRTTTKTFDQPVYDNVKTVPVYYNDFITKNKVGFHESKYNNGNIQLYITDIEPGVYVILPANDDRTCLVFEVK